jgi:heat shock protein HtpX
VAIVESDAPNAFATVASALEKLEAYSERIPLPVNPAVSHLFIVKPLTGFSVQGLFSTHPPTAERAARLRMLARQMVNRT